MSADEAELRSALDAARKVRGWDGMLGALGRQRAPAVDPCPSLSNNIAWMVEAALPSSRQRACRAQERDDAVAQVAQLQQENARLDGELEVTMMKMRELQAAAAESTDPATAAEGDEEATVVSLASDE